MSDVFHVEVDQPMKDLPPATTEVNLSNLTLVDYTDPILRTPVPKFSFTNPPVDPIEFAHALVKKMQECNGLGLSANQLGLPYRCFAMAGEPNYVCYNPVLVGHGNDEEKSTEGCLSYPNLYVPVKRFKSIKVRFTMPNGDTTTKVFAGLTARIFQHEMDHMEGILPLAKGSSYDIKSAIDKARRFTDTNYYVKHLRNENV